MIFKLHVENQLDTIDIQLNLMLLVMNQSILQQAFMLAVKREINMRYQLCLLF